MISFWKLIIYMHQVDAHYHKLCAIFSSTVTQMTQLHSFLLQNIHMDTFRPFSEIKKKTDCRLRLLLGRDTNLQIYLMWL